VDGEITNHIIPHKHYYTQPIRVDLLLLTIQWLSLSCSIFKEILKTKDFFSQKSQYIPYAFRIIGFCLYKSRLKDNYQVLSVRMNILCILCYSKPRKFNASGNSNGHRSETRLMFYLSTIYLLSFPPRAGRSCMTRTWYSDTNVYSSRLIPCLENRLGTLRSIVSLPNDPETSFLILWKGFVVSLGVKLLTYSFTQVIIASSPLVGREQVIGGWTINTVPCFIPQLYFTPAFSPSSAPGELVKH